MSDSHPFPDDYSQPGSAIYYALRFAPREQRPELALTNACTRSLLNIPRECSDPGVAVRKLHWWRDELARARRGHSEHPLIRRLGRLCRQRPLLDTHFNQLFQLIGQEITRGTVENWEQLDRHCQTRGSLPARVLTITAGGTEDQQRRAETLGRFVGLAEIIRDLGNDLRHNRCLLPADALRQRGLRAETLHSQEQKKELEELLAETTERYRELYRATLEQLPTGPKPALGPALSLAAMADALLREIAREDYRVMHQRISLTPLRKLWIARRCHRHARSQRG